VTNFAPLGIYGQVQLVDELEGPVNFSLDNADYKLDKPFFIKNNKQIQLLLRIKIPPGAPNGDYYYNFNITSNPAGSIDQTSTSYTAATVGSNILITVTDSQNFQIVPQIADFIIVNGHKIKFAGNVINLFDSTDPIIVRLVLKNNGNNMIKSGGEIKLQGTFGEKADFGINPDNVLANASRLLTASPSASLNCQSSKIRQPAECQQPNSLVLSGFFAGRYQLKANLTFAAGKKTITRSIIFYGIPIKLILATLLSIIIVVVIYKRIEKE